ncbi:MAG: 5-deoxy-glucuronate isomerase [Bacteroidota bacterium]
MTIKKQQSTHPSEWKFTSPEKEGFHEVVTPGNSPCTSVWAFRLNLEKGNTHILTKDNLELNGAVVHGKVMVKHQSSEITLEKFDSFYLPGNDLLEIEALSDAVIFIGGGLYEGKGQFFTRKYDLSLPLGDIHQVHGKPPYKREVFMTLAQQDEGSRLICGITYGEEGKWTSWPPHQHSKDLEEVYCYFDIPAPKKAFHFASRKEGEFEFIHPVSTGDFVIIPEGYHPTCGMPGVKSCYFWIMAAHKPESRRYDLAINDPSFH